MIKDLNPFILLKKVRSFSPVVHHITNWVTIYDCANIVKCFGGSPVMAHAIEEASDMTKISNSLVINIGTLTKEVVEAMNISIKTANEKGIPVIFDVCGAGATKFRNEVCENIIKNFKIDIIKGNASEIAKIYGEDVKTRGVDSTDIALDLKILAQNLAKKYNCVVVITGEKDIVADKDRIFIIENGKSIMSDIVGTGCMATSVIGTFAGVDKDYVISSVCALVCFEVAAEIAEEESSGIGTFKQKLFDEVYNLEEENIKKRMRIFLWK
jgi:hydroxyethylthiazole kinase